MNVKMILAVLLISLSAKAQKPEKTGKEIFETRCAKCHGKDGTKGLFGAINLKGSRIGDNERTATIANGRRYMPSWKGRLNEQEIKRVAEYVKTLRKS
jgi:cytochrome c6